MTASRNRGGMFLRARVVPVNPNTERQGVARSNMAAATHAWSNTLSDSQLDGWRSYAQNTPVVDRLGAQLILSGQQMFVRCQLPRLIAGLEMVLVPPTTSGLAETPSITTPFTWIEHGNLTGSVTVEGAGTAGDLLIYVSQVTSPSRTVAHAKRAFAGLEGPPVANVFTVSLTPAELPYDGAAGQISRVTVVYLGDDGRSSSEVFQDVVLEIV